MPVEIRWYMPESVLLARYYGDITPDDIYKQYTIGIEMIEAVDTPLVHLIVDTTEVQSFPQNIMEFKSLLGDKAQNAGWVVLVGDNKLIRFLTNIISGMMKLHITYVSTVDEALKFVIDRDPDWDMEDALDMTIPYGAED